MAGTIDIYQVDSFTDELFSGNPAAICPLREWLPDGIMQKIAAENNLSETAFFVRNDDATYSIRWFTPELEIGLCGHATLASAFVLFTQIDPSASKVIFKTKKNEQLTVYRKDDALVMDFPRKMLYKTTNSSKMDGAKAIFGDTFVNLLDDVGDAKLDTDRTYVAVLNSEQVVKNFTPNFVEIRKHGFDYLIITAKSDKGGVSFVSRFFAPGAGIPEDPVTGSAHCLLAPYWSQILNKSELLARQLSLRGGSIWCSVLDKRVLLKGHAVIVLKGKFFLPGSV